MPVNHLEQLVSEWLEYQGFFVRRNTKVGKRKEGGYECELDIVAFHPGTNRLVHYEPSTDTNSWAKREERYLKKFEAGRKYVATLFEGIVIPDAIEQYALFLYGSNTVHKELAGGKVVMMADFVKEITNELRGKKIAKAIVPEQFALLRVLHLACEFRSSLFGEDEGHPPQGALSAAELNDIAVEMANTPTQADVGELKKRYLDGFYGHSENAK